MNRNFIAGILSVIACASITFGQMQLHSFYSRSVTEGRALQTKIDSLLLDTRVTTGVAVTRCAMVVTPGSYMNTKEQVEPVEYDSIEITMSFRLPTDFVADSMWLWIDGEPVPAFIQDRALAAQQYNQVVGRRRDPALMETWGNGSYSLRIFPASSMKSRKIMIEFHHTFDDDSASLMTACLPFVYDSTLSRYYYGYQVFDKTIGVVQATFNAEGPGEYSVSMPGLGTGSFSSSKALTLSASKVVKLDPGTIMAVDPSGADEFLWVARDAKSDEIMTAGVSLELSDETMRFENEPDTRIIVIDMRNNEWDWNEYYRLRAESYGSTYTSYAGYQKYNVWERAQKFAILALQQYITAGQKFNVLIGGESVQAVFDAPVEASAANIKIAATAVIAASADPKSSTEALLETAIAQASDGIVIFISDLFQPPTYYTRVDDKITVSDDGNDYNELLARLAKMVRESDITLFSISDLYQLTRIAMESGGYQLSGVLNRYNIAYSYKVVDGKRIAVPELPALFGNLNRSGLRNVTITSSELSDVVYTIDGYYNYYYNDIIFAGASGGEIMITDDATVPREGGLAKMVLPTTSYYNQIMFLRIAGKIGIGNSGKSVAISIRGKMGGLWFTQDIDAVGNYTPESSSYRPIVSPQWAFRKSENMAIDDYAGNAAAIKTIGKEYHIVTRQTSLLALEPGMELWEDTTWQQQTQTEDGAGFGGGVVADESRSSDFTAEGSAPSNSIGTGVDFDGISLDDILLNHDIAHVITKQKSSPVFSIKNFGNMVRITAPGLQPTDKITLQLYDLKGRLVARKQIAALEMSGSTMVWNLGESAHRLSKGLYTMHISAGSIKKVFRITLMGR